MFGEGAGRPLRHRCLLPFTQLQIMEHLEKHGRDADECNSMLSQESELTEAVRVPFVLRLFLEAFPKLKERVEQKQIGVIRRLHPSVC